MDSRRYQDGCWARAQLETRLRQLARRPSHAFASVIVVFNPTTGQAELYVSDTLAFGQVAAVNGFCRVGQALNACAVRLFSLIVSDYVDDFTQIELSRLADSAASTFESMLRMLGWVYADDGEKYVQFQGEFAALGVVFNLSRAAQSGELLLPNKPTREDKQIVAEIKKS